MKDDPPTRPNAHDNSQYIFYDGIEDIAFEDIVFDPECQPRCSEWDDAHTETAFINSLKEDGLAHLPIVEGVPSDEPPNYGEGQKYTLISGHRRVKALMKMGHTFTECMIKRPMPRADRLAFIIRLDLNTKEFTGEEKKDAWGKHWRMVHDAKCGCDFSSVQKCTFSIRAWARSMGISEGTAKRYVRWPGQEPCVTPTQAPTEPDEVEVRIRLRGDRRTRLEERAKKDGMKVGQVIAAAIDAYLGEDGEH